MLTTLNPAIEAWCQANHIASIVYYYYKE